MWLLLHIHTHTQGPLSSSLVNDAPNLARNRNESKVSSHHHHHHHHSSAGPWLSPSHIICSRENIIFFSVKLFLCVSLFSLLLTFAVFLSFHIIPCLYLFCSHCKSLPISSLFPLSPSVCVLLFLLDTHFLSTFSPSLSMGRLFFKKQAKVIQTTWI